MESAAGEIKHGRVFCLISDRSLNSPECQAEEEGFWLFFFRMEEDLSCGGGGGVPGGDAESKTDDSADVCAALAGLAITCNRLLKTV